MNMQSQSIKNIFVSSDSYVFLQNLEALVLTSSRSEVLVEPVDNLRQLLEPNGNVVNLHSNTFVRPFLPRTSSSHSHLDKYLKKFGKSGERSYVFSNQIYLKQQNDQSMFYLQLFCLFCLCSGRTPISSQAPVVSWRVQPHSRSLSRLFPDK